MPRFELADDGTLDTVVRCTECGHEDRYNYDPDPPDAPDVRDSDVATEDVRVS